MYKPRYSKAGGLLHRGGRPPGPNPRVHHRTPEITGRGPHRIVLKVLPGLAIDRAGVAREVEGTFRDGEELGRFRLDGYSLEDDHVHLRVHAKDADELGRAMKAITSRFARAMNRALGRSGKVFADRYRILGAAKDGVKTLRCGCPVKKAAPRPGRSARPR
jgi:hypothetical protein